MTELTEFETMKSNVLSELEAIEEYIQSISSNNYQADKPHITRVRSALIDAKAYFETMIEEITE